MSRGVSRVIKKLDIFGAGYNLTFEGEETYQSIFGGLLGLLIYIIVLFYSY